MLASNTLAVSGIIVFIEGSALLFGAGPSSVFATVKYESAESALQAATALNGRLLPATSAYCPHYTLI